MPRVNGPDILTGRAEFSIDVSRPGMLYGRILGSPYSHAKITSIDTSQAEALPGVVAVVTYKDAPANPIPVGLPPSDLYVLDSELRCLGDEVAAVAATDPFIAEAALDLITVQYQELPTVFTPTDALAPGAPLVHAGGNEVTTQEIVFTNGDAEAAFAASDHQFENDFSTPRTVVVGINPQVALAEWSADGSLTVWDSNQCVYDRQRELAGAFGIPETKVTVISKYCGCGFGEDNRYRYLAIAALLAKKANRPVKLEPGKAYQWQVSQKRRHPTSGHSKLGIMNDGTIKAFIVDSLWDKGAYASGGQFVPISGNAPPSDIYSLTDFSYTATVAYTNNPPSGAFRGYGVPQIEYYVETLVNEAAEQLGLDPVQIRLNNRKMGGQPCYSEGGIMNNNGIADCLTQGAQAFGWASKWVPFSSRPHSGTLLTGVAAVLGINTSGEFYDTSSVTVLVNLDGSASVQTSIAEMGTGIVTVYAQIAAEELGVNFEDIVVVGGQTGLPDAGCQDGTRMTHTTGEAVRRAAADAKAQLFAVAAQVLNVQPTDLSAKGGSIYVTADPSQSVTIADVMHNPAIVKNVIGQGKIEAPEGLPHSMSYAAHFAEVQVDAETGSVNVVQYVAAHDCGLSINPLTSESQINGGVMQGLGYSLAEQFVIDPNNHAHLSNSYLDYGLLSSDTTPSIQILLIEPGDPNGPFGAKGIGELPLDPGMALIGSAIRNAIGVWLDPPFTPAKILQALGKV